MIQFRQKTFSEYDAMRALYVELLKRGDKNKWKVIDKNSLIPAAGPLFSITGLLVLPIAFNSLKFCIFLAPT